MPRQLHEIVTHIRMVIANPQVSTTLIQTEDLEVLCAATDENERLRTALEFYASASAADFANDNGFKATAVLETN